MEWRSRLQRFDPEFSAALLGFNAEAVVYCKGISDIVAQGVRDGIHQNAPESREGSRSPASPDSFGAVRAQSQLDLFHAGEDVGKVFSGEVRRRLAALSPGGMY